MSVFDAVAAKVPSVRNAQGEILTDDFLSACDLVLPVIDKLGQAFFIVKSDIGNNIQRLRTRFLSSPLQFELIDAIIDDEVARNVHTDKQSCTKGLLWLKRALEFTVAIMVKLVEEPDAPLPDLALKVYYATLNRWHGFFVTSAIRVTLSLVPSREAFMEAVAAPSGPECIESIQRFTDSLSPLLAQVHALLDARGLDDPAKV